MKRIFVLILVLIFIAVILAAIDFYHKVYTPFKDYPQTIKIQINRGASVSAVGRLLYSKRIISSYPYFRIYYRIFFKGKSFKSGEYLFDRALKMREVIEKLVEGKVVLYKVTIKEGLIIREIAELLEKKIKINRNDFINAANNTKLIKGLDSSAKDLEGYLFPDTYFIRKDISATEMVKLMVKKFRDNFSQSMRWQAEQLKLSVRQIVTLASLIEKETASREERFLISSVFHNRLRIGMPMGCDPTIIYALKRDNLYKGKLTWDNLKYDSPYNTRLYRGLPPGAICSPGYASVEAALFPENTKYLYFVAKDTRTHYFSKTLKEHNWAVRKFIINKPRNK